MTCVDILGGLTDIAVENPSTKGPRKKPTMRRTPTLAEIMLAGGNICEND